MCLNYLQVELQGVCNIKLACIVLHNIATKWNVPLCYEVNDAPEPAENKDIPPTFSQNENVTLSETISEH